MSDCYIRLLTAARLNGLISDVRSTVMDAPLSDNSEPDVVEEQPAKKQKGGSSKKPKARANGSSRVPAYDVPAVGLQDGRQ